MADSELVGLTKNNSAAGTNLLYTQTSDGNTDETMDLSGLAARVKALESLLADVVEDTTPQLGGDLDLNSSDITGTGNINITGTLDTSGTATLGALVGEAVVTNAETASFTFALTDAGKLTTISNAGATTATIPPNSSVAFPTNTILYLAQIGAGAATWTEGSGVTINTNTAKYSVNGNGEPTTGGQYAISFARKTATDIWEVYGDLVTLNPVEPLIVPLGDESTALTASTTVAKYTLYAPYTGTITDIQGFITTAPTDATLIMDVHLNGTTIMSTNKVQIETGEFDSDDAATQPTLTTTAVTRGDKFEFFVDQIGSTVAGAGAKIALTMRRT